MGKFWYFWIILGRNAKRHCLILKSGAIKWAQKDTDNNNDECADSRRHICYKAEDQGAPCKPPYYNLEKCVRFFPEAGLLNIEDTKLFCSLNGGELPELASDPTADPDYLTCTKEDLYLANSKK